ncbi:hypothetical protein N0V82_010070 [Gnomoniopsis sp. IMI 355080]|nr:hypothetical protein N0V82_010070 [Gnomoniopsis sp. IMI 355080]
MAVVVPIEKVDQLAMVAVAVIFGGISTGAVALRILVAVRIAKRGLDASDICILIAWILTMGLVVTCISEAVLGGFGWHYGEIVANFGQDPIVQYHKILLALECLWNLSLTMTKMSVLFFYCKVFAVTHVGLVAKITMVFVALLGVSGFLSTMLVCRPFAYNWDLDIPGGYCGSQSAVFAVFAIMSLVTDLAVLTMPIRTLVGLQLPLWKKASLLATFAVGFLACIVSIIRMVFLSKIDYNDVTFTSVPAVLLSAVEPSLAVVLACVPLLRPLISRDKRFGTSSNSRKSVGLSTWASSRWDRSKTQDLSRTRGSMRPVTIRDPGLIRLGSSEIQLNKRLSGLRSAILNHSRYDSDDATELRYVLNPGEGVSHSAHVEALTARSRVSLEEDEEMRQQIVDIEAERGNTNVLAIVVKQEWAVEIEPKTP